MVVIIFREIKNEPAAAEGQKLTIGRYLSGLQLAQNLQEKPNKNYFTCLFFKDCLL
jgi:hypothetical protein